jgi:organic hydroperoxide reductase OsmC/OhrA
MDTDLSLSLVQHDGYRFEVDFGVPGVAPLFTDEPPPLGDGSGPNPARVLSAAIANCLAASLSFALRKFHNQHAPLRADARCSFIRNAQGRLRIGRVSVQLRLGDPASALQQLPRALAQFEDFCVVTQSVRAGFPVDVQVLDAEGLLLTAAAEATA